jgi:L-seryl-tRNA(Ser) seleniumtransferase
LLYLIETVFIEYERSGSIDPVQHSQDSDAYEAITRVVIAMFRIPSGLQQLLPPLAANKLVELMNQPNLASAVREAAQKLGWQDANAPAQVQELWHQAKQWFESAVVSPESTDAPRSAFLNGTGEIFSSSVAGIPLPTGIAELASRTVGYASVDAIEKATIRKLCELSGAEDALVVHNVEQAIRLLAKLEEAKDGWIIPRSDFVSWSARSHLGSCLSESAIPILTVGSINHCSIAELRAAIRGTRHGVLRQSPNPVVEKASSTRSSVEDLYTDLRKEQLQAGVVYAEVLFDGVLHELKEANFHHTNIRQRFSSGTDLVIVPGDRLLGGPSCGIVLGSKSMIASLTEQAERQGVKAHPLICALLGNVLDLQKDFVQWRQLPVGAMLLNSLANLRDRAKRLQFQIQDCAEVVSCEIVESNAAIGDYLWSSDKLPGIALAISFKSGVKEWLADVQREKGLTVIAHQSDDRLVIQLRSIDPADDRLLADLFPPREEAVTSGAEHGSS